MIGLFRVLIVIVALGGAWAAASAEPPLQLAPREGVLLLRSGQVIPGRIIPAGDHYLVSRPHGEYRFRSSDVEMLCKDLDEVYQRKRAQIKLGKVAEHVDLADWCLKNDLIDHAETQLTYALAADATYPRIRLLERRLELARRDDEDARPAPQHAAQRRGPTNDELDRFIRGMPGNAVETFTSTIQPLLVNNCTTSGCHGPQSDARLQLLRIPLGSPPTRRTTQRNLYAVWQHVNPNHPEQSPLLVEATQRHGDSKAAIFNDHDAAQYLQLAAWVSQFGRGGQKPTQPATVKAPAAPLLQSMPPATPARQVLEASGNPQTKLSQPAAESPLESSEEPPSAESGASGPAAANADGNRGKAERKPRPADYTPVDPFDPEIFNRKYHPDE
ncbi:MAG TPA: hypothetical protein VHC19_23930 [Pirellulales bacterium]|nr:hypothetical protein [Pirellulales bacterium]